MNAFRIRMKMGHLHDNCSIKYSYFILKNTSLLHAEILVYLHAIYIKSYTILH